MRLAEVGEDGLAGLPDASREAIAGAEVIFGGPRHLALVGAGTRGRAFAVLDSVSCVSNMGVQQGKGRAG